MYYKAYDDRYKQYHALTSASWAEDKPSEVLIDILNDCGANLDADILEIGCGEGQNALFLMKNGYRVTATDVSAEAIDWCKTQAQKRGLDASKFFVLDILNTAYDKKFDVVLSVSTLHMLVLDRDRKGFWDFVYKHLNEAGVAIVTVMGDGEYVQNNTDITKAFDLVTRKDKFGKEVKVASTSCRIVNWKMLFDEIDASNMKVERNFLSEEIEGFSTSMVVVVTKK